MNGITWKKGWTPCWYGTDAGGNHIAEVYRHDGQWMFHVYPQGSKVATWGTADDPVQAKRLAEARYRETTDDRP